MASAVINTSIADSLLQQLSVRLANPAPMYGEIAGMLEAETEFNLDAEGRPSWVPLAESTKRERLKRNNGSSLLKILQDRGILAASVASDHGDSWAMISAGGAASDYALIQQVGGTIDRAATTVKTRLRTDAKGNLVRQAKDKRLAVFAKDSHKRVRETMSEVGPFSINIPGRPYLPFFGSVDNATLQPQAEAKLIDIVARYLEAPFGG